MYFFQFRQLFLKIIRHTVFMSLLHQSIRTQQDLAGVQYFQCDESQGVSNFELQQALYLPTLFIWV